MSVRRVKQRDNFVSISSEHLLAENENNLGGSRRGSGGSGWFRGDGKNIAILFFLYLLQGIPLGLMQAIPIIMTNSGISYKQQAQFSLVNWPFSLKLLWAPIVDSLYWSKMGKRKSWLVPIQYLIGILMLTLSFGVESLIGGSEPSIVALVVSFFILNFLAATQDIAVDGWALTMLKRENVGYASTCNSVGQTAGYMFGYVALIALESASFCNGYLRPEPLPHGIVTLQGFLWFWGWVFLLTTSLIWWLKSEISTSGGGGDGEAELSVKESYKMLWRITTLPPIRLLAVVLLTAKVAFSACDALTGLKLIEAGVPKEKLALLAVPMVPLQIVLPLVLARATTGKNPLTIYLKSYPYRLGFGVLIASYVWLTPSFISESAGVPYYYYLLLILLYGFYQVTLYSMFVSQMAFFAKISDPAVGGTYMTLVNTLANMGGNWPTTAALWLVESFTQRQCSIENMTDLCTDKDSTAACTEAGGVCKIAVDGYYIEVLACTVFGVLWLMWGRHVVHRLQAYPMKAFAVSARTSAKS